MNPIHGLCQYAVLAAVSWILELFRDLCSSIFLQSFHRGHCKLNFNTGNQCEKKLH